MIKFRSAKNYMNGVIISLLYFIFSLRTLGLDWMSIHPDITLFGLLAEKVYLGEIFLKDFYEVSPYPIFLFYLPVTFFYKVLDINLFTSIGIYLWALFSYVIFQFFRNTTNYFKNKNDSLRVTFLVFLILIVPELGQREVIFSSLLLTYIFGEIYPKEREGKLALLNQFILLFLLVWSSFLKPQFLMILLGVILSLYKFRLYIIPKIVYMAIGSVLLLNILYLQNVNFSEIPFYLEFLRNHVDGNSFYSRFMWVNSELFWAQVAFSGIMGSLGLVFSFKIDQHRKLLKLLSIVSLVGVLFALLQNKGWMYHMYSSTLVTLVCCSLLILEFKNKIKGIQFQKFLKIGLEGVLLLYIGFVIVSFHKGMKIFFLDKSKKEFDTFFSHGSKGEKKIDGMFFTDNPFFMNYLAEKKLKNLNSFLWTEPIPIIDSKVEKTESYLKRVDEIFIKDFQKKPSFIAVNKFCVFCTNIDAMDRFVQKEKFKNYIQDYDLVLSLERYDFYLKKDGK